MRSRLLSSPKKRSSCIASSIIQYYNSTQGRAGVCLGTAVCFLVIIWCRCTAALESPRSSPYVVRLMSCAHNFMANPCRKSLFRNTHKKRFFCALCAFAFLPFLPGLRHLRCLARHLFACLPFYLSLSLFTFISS